MSLPQTRYGITKKIRLGNWTLYVTLNSVDGKPVEMFIKYSRRGHSEGLDGSPLAYLDTMAKGASRQLQAGVPLATVLGDWRFTRFPPDQLGVGTSPLDAIAREYMTGEET